MKKIIKVGEINIGEGRPKICGPVLGKTEEEIISQVALSNMAACDFIEFRIDHFDGVSDIETAKEILGKVRNTAKKPVLFTFRSLREGGEKELSYESYRELLLAAAGEGLADIIDVEMSALKENDDLVGEIKKAGAAVIMSKHDFQKTPSKEEITEILSEMERKGADIAKVAFMPVSKSDVFALMEASCEASEKLECPVVAISMGSMGAVTRVCGEFMGSAVTFASIAKASAPGQLDAGKLLDILETIH